MDNVIKKVNLAIMSLLCLPFFFVPLSTADQEKENSVWFVWSFGAMVGPENDKRVVAVEKNMALNSGDKIKFSVELKKECFIYIIYYSSEGEWVTLFPYGPGNYSSCCNIDQKYLIPEGDGWFELDENAGREIFYLLASGIRLRYLESLLKQYESAGESTDKGILAKKVLKEIRRINKKHRNLTSKAERPVSTGGTVRELEQNMRERAQNLDAIKEEVSVKNFYSRTFTIEHK